MRWRKSQAESQIESGRAMPLGGRIGSNQELGIECSGDRRQGRCACRAASGWREFAWLALSSVLVAAGLLMVYSAKTQSFPEQSAALARGELLDLNRVSKPEQLLPFLQVFQDEAERGAAANKIVRLSGDSPAASERWSFGAIASCAACPCCRWRN